jgi:polyhydroxyalkanoate synthase
MEGKVNRNQHHEDHVTGEAAINQERISPEKEENNENASFTFSTLDFKKEYTRWRGFFSHWLDPEPETANTPREAVWKKNKAVLWYYPAVEKKYRTPVYLVYSLVNQPVILDLQPIGSKIKAFTESGFEVYLLDFGSPGYEDRDINVDDYIVDYIQKGAKRVLKHSGAGEISVIGYCLGGTFAAVYAAIADEPIQNLVLIVAPFDFHSVPFFEEWAEPIRSGRVSFDEVMDSLGVLPAGFIKAGVRLITSPVYFSPYLSLLNKSHDPAYVEKWRRFNSWTEGHIPFTGAAMKQLFNDFAKENKLINGNLTVRGKKVDLTNIHSNLLVASSQFDRLVPHEQSAPIMDLVSSTDKTYKLLEGGHTHMVAKAGNLPEFLEEWLPRRSNPINTL